ncbi:hypothetical protein CI109_101160 [Kwoniella shandongensis]|uniref:ATP-dependent DNA helicase PIF1 n=1 Tax=Kwoniella shandongensis TaxID=1734106 RepID=A0A5M6C8X0_9TREE|nr:uncharacterized protein CI109_001629 [Kwoniella shandongensis]KAA5530222.1 hypothetical protein CI109_001629 [Kwoniella shandongensis]
MPKSAKVKFYGVMRGRQPGVYTTWDEAQKQVSGFPGAVHKAFPTYQEAETWSGMGKRMDRSSQSSYDYAQGHRRPHHDRDHDYNNSHKRRRSPSPRPVPDVKARSTDQEVDIGKSAVIQQSAADPPLSEQQSRILARILEGESFFFTGSAGTGKSVLLRAIIRTFKENEKKEEDNVEKNWRDYLNDDGLGRGRKSGADVGAEVKRWKLGVTASTGMAGVNIGGSTIHSWAGIGLGDLPAQKLYEKILRNKITSTRWRTTAALIIDEVSMIDATLFDKLEEIARKIRRDPRPFGGLQLILSGDFFQLPPVAKGSNTYAFAFEATSWPQIFNQEKNNMMSLTRVFRQKEDRFVRVLEGMRRGMISDQDALMLKSLEREVKYEGGIEPVGLYPQKSEVATINAARLAALKTPIQIFLAWDVPGITSSGYALDQPQATASLDRNTIWPKELELKVGALVMLVTNMQDGVLVNGSTGVVVDFMTIADAMAEGVSLPAAAFGGAPDPNTAWPVVEFTPSKHASGKQSKRVIIPQMSVDVLNALGKPEATRHQVPLILAWALTIHKSQGQTIERVKIDLNKIFVEGQTYVAISRAVSLENLELKNFTADRVMAHKRVIEWARPLEQEQAAEEEWDDLVANCDLEGY